MLILLPPSETKQPGGHKPYEPERLRYAAELTDARARVRAALESVSRDEDAAARALGVGAKSRADIAHNLRLSESPALPAIERYTGVLYDALRVHDLTEAARTWIDEHVCVQSALFGLIGAGDLIPTYRLSAGSRLPDLGSSVKALWRDAHHSIEWEQEFILDLRSKAYAELAPLGAANSVSLQVGQRSDDGRVRALNHFNKAAKGDLVRRLASSLAQPTSAAELGAWAADEGLEIVSGPTAHECTLITSLGAPLAHAAR